MPMTLVKTLLWSGNKPILDVAILEGDASPTRIAVLSPEDLSLYRMQAGKWQAEQKLSINHLKPWPLDLHGSACTIADLCDLDAWRKSRRCWRV